MKARKFSLQLIFYLSLIPLRQSMNTQSNYLICLIFCQISNSFLISKIHIGSHVWQTRHVKLYSCCKIQLVLHCISQIKTSFYSWSHKNFYNRSRPSNYMVFCQILFDFHQISNFTANQDFAWFTISYHLLVKYYFEVPWKFNTNGCLRKINIYFYLKMMWYITEMCDSKSVMKILYDVIYLIINI